MSETVLLGVVALSGIFGLIGIWLMNHYWLVRQDTRQKYLERRAGMAVKKKIPAGAVAPTGMLANLASILKSMESLDIDPNQAMDLIGGLSGGEIPETDTIGELLQSPVVQNFVKGLNQGPKGPQEGEQQNIGY